jgi:peroxiredoxin
MEPAKKVIRFAQSNSLPYRTLLDEDGSVGSAYSVIGVPMIMLLDKAGNIVKVGHSSKDMPLDNVLK